jgi:hypothetical protein
MKEMTLPAKQKKIKGAKISHLQKLPKRAELKLG